MIELESMTKSLRLAWLKRSSSAIMVLGEATYVFRCNVLGASYDIKEIHSELVVWVSCFR